MNTRHGDSLNLFMIGRLSEEEGGVPFRRSDRSTVSVRGNGSRTVDVCVYSYKLDLLFP